MTNTLFLFDIDDTLTDSMSNGSKCFAETFKSLFSSNEVSIDWSTYPHVTDWGLCYELFKRHMGSKPSNDDIRSFEAAYNQRLEEVYNAEADSIKEVPGAKLFIKHLQDQNIPCALATGGWSYSAKLKLHKAGYDLSDHIPLASSDDAWSRASIMHSGIKKSEEFYSKPFEKVIYFGDGLWDLITCKQLDIPLIGIDIHGNEILKKEGLQHVFPDFLSPSDILEAANQLL